MKSKTRSKIDSPPWDVPGNPLAEASETVRNVARSVYERIVRGHYPAGSQLPPERKIGEEFDVSRTVVRKSLELLEACNFVAGPHGRRKRVIYQADQQEGGTHQPSPDASESAVDVAEMTSPLELNVVRSIVEPEIARLAIINMSARDIANLRSIVDRMSAVTTSASDFARWDEQFHLALAEGARNTLLTAIYRLINDVRRHAHWNATRAKNLSPNRIRDYQKLYRSICTSLEARDIESAVEFVKLVMVEAQRDLTLDA